MKQEKQEVRVEARISPELTERLEKLAKRNGRSRVKEVEFAILEAVKKAGV